MRLKLLFIFVLASLTGAYAQSARTILDNASATYSKVGGITASFTLDMKDTASGNVYSSDGTIKMKGDRFCLDIPEMTTWYDGKTQWVYVKGTDEVNITEPTGEELQGLSPSSIFSIYKTGFNLIYKGQKTERGASVLEVEMTPLAKNDNLQKIIVQVNKATNLFSKIVVYDTSGYENTLIISKIQSGVSLPDNTFSFDEAAYPDAEIVDLR
ncbi:LolA-like putative outer membrane lipoprotein chaperone [Dysgonomonas sp. 25]|uniref:LolA family protein n=1 Tax=Dysgonomonas sp. 25 TaxID=2302933 RepID=UPI0013D8C71F|nr:LolA-like putative outer membrane lipoprotein chaperone [Dysgonomonas sp. 25]NDV69788.1 hypothetical protein [Dysgonomonas sp. 25]